MYECVVYHYMLRSGAAILGRAGDMTTIWIYLVDVREGQRHPVTTGTDELAGTVQEKLRRKEPKSLR